MKIKLICFTTYFSNLEIIQIIFIPFPSKNAQKTKKSLDL